MKKHIIFLTIFIALTIFIFGCTASPQTIDATAEGNWRNAVFTDVTTGNDFKVSDFKGKPILLESFAVWCPVCTRQQQEIKKLHEELGDTVISISLDTDPNEDIAIVKNHVENNGFNWLYAISPKKDTQSLIDEFSVNIVNAPAAPVVLICEDLSARFLGKGVKDVEELKEEIAKGC